MIPMPKNNFQTQDTQGIQGQSTLRSRRLNLPKKRSFRELDRRTQVAIILAGIIELTLMFAALRDLRRRPVQLARGPKPLWAVVSCLNVLGSISYFVFGRRKDPQN